MAKFNGEIGKMGACAGTFTKMHGAGNDFVVLSEWLGEGGVALDTATIQALCERRRGIGADGLIVLGCPAASDSEADAAMGFFNSDGSPADTCGNGLRCAALHLNRHALGGKLRISIRTAAGALVRAEIRSGASVSITLPVRAMPREVPEAGAWFCDSGVPHAVRLVDGLDGYDVAGEGARLRRHPAFGEAGANVDFLEPLPDGKVAIRTFERGVEAETMACGTGAVASALCLGLRGGFPPPIHLVTRQGDILKVDFDAKAAIVEYAELTGPAVEVFRGEWPGAITSKKNGEK